METAFWILIAASAASAYLIGGVNGAIILSNLVYHKDIRDYGSGNPGFTNFKRVFGGATAWFAMLIDIMKTALPVLVFGLLFRSFCGDWQFGAAFTGLCAMLGHAYPVWYGFKGGKTFIAGATTIWFVDWRAALVATVVFMLLLFTIKYMSLASMTAAVICPIMLAVLGVSSPAVLVVSVLSAMLLIWRHKANIVRLCAGTEKVFSFKKKPEQANG